MMVSFNHTTTPPTTISSWYFTSSRFWLIFWSLASSITKSTKFWKYWKSIRILASIGIRRLLGLSLGFASSSSSTQPWEEVLLIAENENSSKSWTPCPAWGEEWGGSQMSSSIYFACNHTCCLVACRCQGNILWRCFMHQFIITEPSLHRQLTWGEENNVRYQKFFS